ncbi:MAG TPA: hypothetical protein VLI68_03860 [Hanamia sp.]|nr:hypothetical protein [Hanamia sp.]
MRKIYLLYFFLLTINLGNSQSVRKPVSASCIGLGAYSINHVDVFSVTSNQAALAQIEKPSVGVFGENRFLVAETNMYSAIVAVPTKEGNFAFQADYFGYKNYNESQLGIAYARKVGTKLDLGIKFNYYSFRIPGFENPSTVNFEIGVICHFTEKLNGGIHIYNPVGGRLSKTENDKLSSIYSFGLGYEASDNFFVSAEIVKQEDLPVNFNAGVQYNFAKQFFARFGIASQNESPYGGAGVSWKNFRLDISASYHPQLGISPGLMLIMNLKPKENEGA